VKKELLYCPAQLSPSVMQSGRIDSISWRNSRAHFKQKVMVRHLALVRGKKEPLTEEFPHRLIRLPMRNSPFAGMEGASATDVSCVTLPNFQTHFEWDNLSEKEFLSKNRLIRVSR
jgi:hypothetical protein